MFFSPQLDRQRIRSNFCKQLSKTVAVGHSEATELGFIAFYFCSSLLFVTVTRTLRKASWVCVCVCVTLLLNPTGYGPPSREPRTGAKAGTEGEAMQECCFL